MDDIRVDVEEPHQPATTISLGYAIDLYYLSNEEVEDLKQGFIVWYKDVALSIHQDDEEEELDEDEGE